MSPDSARIPVMILLVGLGCILLSVFLALALGADDYDPLLSPAFISIGLTFIYGGSFFLVKPKETASFLRGSRADWIPPRIRGAFLVVFGLWWTLVGVSVIFA